MGKTVVDLYYKPESSPTKKIISFIDVNEGVMDKYFFRFKNVTHPNVKAEAKKHGVKRAPSIVIEGVLYSGAEPIIKVLSGGLESAPRRATPQPISDEDMLNKFMMREAMTPEDDDDIMTEGMDQDEIRKRTMALSSKKPHCKKKESMSGTSTRSRPTTPNRIPKSQSKMKPKPKPKTAPRSRRVADDDDAAFLRKAGRDNIDPRGDSTGGGAYPIEDGESLLEKYYASVSQDGSF